LKQEWIEPRGHVGLASGVNEETDFFSVLEVILIDGEQGQLGISILIKDVAGHSAGGIAIVGNGTYEEWERALIWTYSGTAS
jgi:hypothetical protein